MRLRILTFLMAIAAGSPVLAQSAPPLVVIRFNQPTIYYDQQLYNAISKAVAIKPDLMIDVVSLAPQTGNGSTDEQWQRAASQHTQHVVATLQQIGVPRARIHVTGQHETGLRYDETRIFVR